uniref:Protein PAT1 homolog 1 n=1 Tax=Dicentrarchus labrax TaxID=13489 RepID=E6ZH60_DICLA|nr:Protein PAT1 homolog 1 [Dicentrarchus labrax]
MDCGLLQAMAEEDEEINVYNEETFGMDLDTHGTTEVPNNGLLQFGELPSPPPPPPPPTPPLDPKPPSRHSSPSPPRQRPQYFPRAPPGQRGRGRGQRGGLGRGQMFEDPAVVRIVQGRPSIKVMHIYSLCEFRQLSSAARLHFDVFLVFKGLDSAIVDCGNAMYQNSFEDDMHSFTVPGSPINLRQPLTPRQHYNQVYTKMDQTCSDALKPIVNVLAKNSVDLLVSVVTNDTGGFMFPMNRPCPSTPQSLTPKMMQLRFGANSPRPSPFYSPSSNSVQHFRKPEGWDPYCNLMTAKEKEWITRLQMIQLQSEHPYLEDYYYQEYYRRIEAKMAEEELGIRGKREPPKLTTPYIMKSDSYTPVVHIEGSLGQVAVSTCYSPRRAISAVNAVQAQCPLEVIVFLRHLASRKCINLPDTDTDTHFHITGTKRHQTTALFIVLLEVEETERMKTTVLSEEEERRLMEKTQKKVEHIYSQLQHHDPLDSGGEFLPFLLVSKGKRLVARLLPFLKHDTALKILRIVTCNLPTLMSRDTEEALPVLYPSLRNVIGGLTFSQLIGLIKDLTFESLTTSESLTLACQNKFGLSLLYALLSQGEKLLSSGVPLEPSIGDFETWTDTIFQVAGQLSQCSLVEPLLLPSNLLTLFCRYLDKRTLHQLKSNME